MKIVNSIIRFLWEFPQNILGLLVWLILRSKVIKTEQIHKRFFFHVSNFGLSLGNFIFWSDTNNAIIEIKQNNKEHEYGHSIQSLIMGPFYLILVGIPSICRVIYGSLYYLRTNKKWAYYYSSYPENWADSLGEKYY